MIQFRFDQRRAEIAREIEVGKKMNEIRKMEYREAIIRKINNRRERKMREFEAKRLKMEEARVLQATRH